MKRIGILEMATLIVVGYFAYEKYWSDPFEEPGETWQNHGLLNGEDIRLLDSGAYVARGWGDLSPDPWITSGHWRRDRNTIVLEEVGAPPAHARKLIKMQWRGCRVLAPEEAIDSRGNVNELMAYVSESEQCAFEGQKL